MSGMFERWMHKLVSAVMQREHEANVVVVDWLPMAQQLYPDAVNHTNGVGLNIAGMLNWLQVCTVACTHTLPLMASAETGKNKLYQSPAFYGRSSVSLISYLLNLTVCL